MMLWHRTHHWSTLNKWGPASLKAALVDAVVDGNSCYKYVDVRGDPDAALASADIVVNHEYSFTGAYQYAMEPHATIAHRHEGGLSVWGSCQHPFLVRRELANLFGLTLEQVQLHIPFIGGGFGSKSYASNEPLACLAAWMVDSPVRLVNTVEEAILTTRQHSMRCSMLTAATSSGDLLLRRATISMDTGAYATNGPTVTFMTGVAAPGPYAWQAIDVNATCVYTNFPPAGSYRGFGSVHTQWISESQLDEVAELAGLDRFDLRRRNLLSRGDVVHPRMKPLDGDVRQGLDKVLEALPSRPSPERGTRIGVGVGFGLIPAGAEPIANALARIRYDGKVTILVGTSEVGQGARTVFAQIAAEVLQIPVDRIVVPGADTSVTPYDRSTGASRSTTLAGLAVERACHDLITQLSSVAARMSGEINETFTYGDGSFTCGECQTSLETVLGSLANSGDEIIGRGRVGTGNDSTDFPVFWELCTASAMVLVDEKTGKVSVLETFSVPDVGKAINPQLVAVQDSGSTVQALGQMLMEEVEFDENGNLLTPSLVQYHVPGAQDIPRRMDCEPLENADGPGPFGAKGCGEGAFGAVSAAIMVALRDAGVQIYDLPATPERVWCCLNPELLSNDPAPAPDGG